MCGTEKDIPNCLSLLIIKLSSCCESTPELKLYRFPITLSRSFSTIRPTAFIKMSMIVSEPAVKLPLSKHRNMQISTCKISRILNGQATNLKCIRWSQASDVREAVKIVIAKIHKNRVLGSKGTILAKVIAPYF